MKTSAMTEPALAVLLLITVAGCATLPDKNPAPPESSQSPNLKCPKISKKIKLDGKLDEPTGRGLQNFRLCFPATYYGGDSATEWDCAMRSNVTVDGTLNNWRDRGWAVELAIPLADLNEVFDERIESGTRLLFSLCRYNYGRYLDAKELSSTSDLAVTNFHRYEDFGTIEFTRE